MPKFGGTTTRPTPVTAGHAVRTTPDPIPTFEGGSAFSRDAKSDLFLLAATNMVNEDTFYEAGRTRDSRYLTLIDTVMADDPLFVAGLARYLRAELFMRSASVILACEYVRGGGPNGRAVIDSVCQRPDEPAEIVGYWMANYGRNLPMPVKRGVADACARLYTERNVLRYDGQSKALRFADVIELAHPRPRDDRQAALFRWLLDTRHNRDDASTEGLHLLAAAANLAKVPAGERRGVLRERGPRALENAGMSWERLSGWLPGGMDAEAWESVIPSMGVMALVRNLRNFDKANISEPFVDAVIARITDPEQVAKARLFPYQVWSAFKNAPSDNWKRALAKTLDLTTANVPSLDGTLVVIDTSGSMQSAVSGRSAVSRVEVAAVMGMVTAKRAGNADVIIYGDRSTRLDIPAGTSVLQGVAWIANALGSVGHGTYGHSAIRAHYNPDRHKRVVLFTDDQQHDAGGVNLDDVPLIYTVNLAGYAPSSLSAGDRGRYTITGFSDAMFTAIRTLEAGRHADWPF